MDRCRYKGINSRLFLRFCKKEEEAKAKGLKPGIFSFFFSFQGNHNMDNCPFIELTFDTDVCFRAIINAKT